MHVPAGPGIHLGISCIFPTKQKVSEKKKKKSRKHNRIPSEILLMRFILPHHFQPNSNWRVNQSKVRKHSQAEYIKSQAKAQCLVPGSVRSRNSGRCATGFTFSNSFLLRNSIIPMRGVWSPAGGDRLLLAAACCSWICGGTFTVLPRPMGRGGVPFSGTTGHAGTPLC